MLRARVFVLQLGATLKDGLQGDIAIPRRTAGGNVGRVTEGSDVPEAGATYDQVTLAPQTLGAYRDLTRKTILQATPDAEMETRAAIAADIAVELDRVAIDGSGVAPEPEGVLQTTGIGSVTSGGKIDYADVVGLLTALGVDNADQGALGFLTNPTIRGTLLTTKKATNTGEFIWGWNPRTPGEGRVLGYKAFATNNISSGTLIFGNWRDLIVGQWGHSTCL